MFRRLRHRIRMLPPGDRLAWTLVLVLAAGAAAVVALDASDAGDTKPASRPGSTETASPSARDGAVRACADMDIPAQPPDAVTCRSRSATLTLVGQTTPLLLGGTQARVIDATRRGRAIVVRLRVRNETGTPQRVSAGGQEIYLSIRGLRVDPRPVPRLRVAAGAGETVSLRFPLSLARARLLARSESRADLGIVPWTRKSASDVRGVIRLNIA